MTRSNLTHVSCRLVPTVAQLTGAGTRQATAIKPSKHTSFSPPVCSVVSFYFYLLVRRFAGPALCAA